MAKVVTVAQQKGGAGKTTLVIHLAVALRGQGLKIGLIDSDPQQSLTGWFQLRERKQGGDTGFRLSTVQGWRTGAELDRMKTACDIVLIDTPPHAEVAARGGIRIADLLLVPAQPSPMDIWATKPTLDLALSEKTPYRVVLNRVPARGRLAEDIREMIIADRIAMAETTLGSRTAFAASLLRGQGVTEYEPAGRAAEEIEALASELRKLVK